MDRITSRFLIYGGLPGDSVLPHRERAARGGQEPQRVLVGGADVPDDAERMFDVHDLESLLRRARNAGVGRASLRGIRHRRLGYA